MYLKFLKIKPNHSSLYFMNNTWPGLKYEADVKSVAAVAGDEKDFNRKSTQFFFSFRQAFFWLNWPLTPAMNWQSTSPIGKNYNNGVCEDEDDDDKDFNRKSTENLFQTSLYLSELTPDSRYELTVNLANRKELRQWCQRGLRWWW